MGTLVAVLLVISMVILSIGFAWIAREVHKLAIKCEEIVINNED